MFTQKICRKEVESKGRVLISPKAEVVIERKAKVLFGKNAKVEQGSTLIVRKEAFLYLGNNAYINRNCVIAAHERIEIHDGVTIGPNCCIYDHDHDMKGGFITKPVIIRKNAWIGAGVLIMKGVTIGEGAVIAAGSIVTHDIADHTVLVQKKTDTLLPLDSELSHEYGN